MPRAYLIDSSIYIFRGWHTLPDSLHTAEQQPNNALLGYADMLLALLEQTRPEYIACAFDQKMDNCWRREIAPDYKANRPPVPEDLRRQFAWCRELVALAGLPGYVSNRYEADDIIGTLSRKLRRHGVNSTIVTADKDLTQLVRAGDVWWEYSKNRTLDEKDIEKRWGVPPAQIADLLALCGDKADNIAGVPGIGAKTAANLLRKFGNVETLLNNIEAVANMKFRGAIRSKNLLAMHADKVRLAKQLTVIANDPQLPDDPSALRPGHYDTEALEAFFTRMNLEPLRRERWHKVLATLS